MTQIIHVQSKEEIAIELGNRVHELMKQAGITIDTVVNATEISRPSLVNLLHGKSIPLASSVLKLADFFAVPTDYLFGRMDEETSRQVLEDYSHRFMDIRRLSYEAYVTAKHHVELPLYPGEYESPWPYNLYEAVVEEPAEHILTKEHMDGMELAFDILTEREHSMLLRHFKDAFSMADIAKEHDLTTERVRQIVARALRKLRSPSIKSLIEFGYDPEVDEKENELMQRRADLEWELGNLSSDLMKLSEKRKLVEHLYGKLEELDKWDAEKNELLGKEKMPINDIPIEDMDLSVRSYNVLVRNGLDTARQIIAADHDGTLMKLRGIGPGSYREIHEKIQSLIV